MATTKAYRKLGYNPIETVSIVKSLNSLLANYQVHYQKLRNYHWNVVGSDFFELHGVFEEEYNAVKANIDLIAERIRVFGQRPLSTLTEYLDESEIKETKGPISSQMMVKEILDDFEILLSFMIESTEAAQEVGDTATSLMITTFVERMEKRHWMLTAFAASE